MDNTKPIIDSCGRKITYLRISITDRCNLRCIYCMPEGGIHSLDHSEIMSYEDILRFVRILSVHGLNKVRITGGEPLVRKGVANFVQKLNEISGIKDVSMTTNGTLLDKYASELYAAGLKRVNISLDSLKEGNFNKITRLGGLDKVFRGIDAVKKIGYAPIKINTVLIKGINDNEIIDFVNFARRHELNLRFIEYMPIGGNISETVTGKEVIENIAAVFGDFNLIRDDMRSIASYPPVGSDSSNNSRSYGFKDNKAVISFISPLSEHFCNDCNRLRFTASGKLRLCLFYDREYDIKEILKQNDDEEVFRQVLDIVRFKPDKHSFNEKVNNQSQESWANDSMGRIGG